MSTLPTIYQDIIALSRYARYIPELKRRETWGETVDRLIGYLHFKVKDNLSEQDLQCLDNDIRKAILNLEVMPSMRLLMCAGEACERDNIAAFNCSYLAINNKRAFSEVLYILMCGTGVGFSCERQEIAKLPSVPEVIEYIEDTVIIGDSKHNVKGFEK